ncbi:MAG TPA: hypothetical protein VL426_03565 [Candidatus Binatia bacterium]|nr:hypothetical protein [Candidatus Binatia bacterium]
MRLSRWFGRWSLKGHDGTEQATPYMDALWRTVLATVARRKPEVRRCLLLGVAMGATFAIVRRDWPEAAVVGVDWEPSLFDLGRKLGVHRGGAGLDFVEGDAAEMVPALRGTFDLALVDLFNGRQVAAAVSDPRLQDAVAAKLGPGGIVAVNCFDQPKTLEGWTARFGPPTMVRYQGNRIGIYVK